MKRRDFMTGALGATAATCLPRGWSTAFPAEISVVTRSGASTTLKHGEIKEFAHSLKRALLHSGSPWYDQARKVWNGLFDDRHPALIVNCIDVEDVVHAVDFARTHDLLVAVRGGGHSISGMSACDGGLIIDLSAMAAVSVNPDAKTVRVEGGALLSDLDYATQPFGLATPSGVVSHTGVGGLTLGGGIGRLMRSHGLTIDSLLSVEIVTADGKRLTANDQQNQDLFWAVRGGGGNFGVATAFEYRLHPIGPDVLIGGQLHGPDTAGDMLKYFFEASADAPRELNFGTGMTITEDGTHLGFFGMTYSGDFAKGKRLMEPYLERGKPLSRSIAPRNYIAAQTGGDAHNEHGRVYFIRGRHVNDYDPAMVDAIMERWIHDPRRFNTMRIIRFGGAVSDVPADATAWPHRDTMWDLEVGASWADQGHSEEFLEWGRDYWRALDPYIADSFYVNELMDEDQEHVTRNYGHNLARLRAIKHRYDPKNLFQLNANIKPKA